MAAMSTIRFYMLTDTIKGAYVCSQAFTLVEHSLIWDYLLKEMQGVKTVQSFRKVVHEVADLCRVKYEPIRPVSHIPSDADRYFQLINGVVIPREIYDIQKCFGLGKDCQKVTIGQSNISSLVLRSFVGVKLLKFSRDGTYTAYERYGVYKPTAEQKLVFSGNDWLAIYDDKGVSYSNMKPRNCTRFDVYLSSVNEECVIHWH